MDSGTAAHYRRVIPAWGSRSTELHNPWEATAAWRSAMTISGGNAFRLLAVLEASNTLTGVPTIITHNFALIVVMLEKNKQNLRFI